jgi:hypothetical protein
MNGGDEKENWREDDETRATIVDDETRAKFAVVNFGCTLIYHS